MNTWQVFGQDWAVELLQKKVGSHSLHHAYLVTGPDGVGRRTMAIRLVQALNCPTPLSPGVPCLTCRICKQIEEGKFFDLMTIQRLGGKTEILIEQVREATRFLSLKPFISTHKVLLFLDIQNANESSFNALLKTLEEAPDYALMVLIANNTDQVPLTILSRCEVLRLRPVSIPQLSEFLTSEGVKGEKLTLLSHLGEGRPGYALNLNTPDSELLVFRMEKLKDMHQLLSQRYSERFSYAENLVGIDYKAREQARKKLAQIQKNFKKQDFSKEIEVNPEEEENLEEGILRKTFRIWLTYWRDVLLITTGSKVEITNIDCAGEIELIAGKLDRSTIIKVISSLETALLRLDHNVNSRLLVEVLMLDIPRVKV